MDCAVGCSEFRRSIEPVLGQYRGIIKSGGSGSGSGGGGIMNTASECDLLSPAFFADSSLNSAQRWAAELPAACTSGHGLIIVKRTAIVPFRRISLCATEDCSGARNSDGMIDITTELTPLASLTSPLELSTTQARSYSLLHLSATRIAAVRAASASGRVFIEFVFERNRPASSDSDFLSARFYSVSAESVLNLLPQTAMPEPVPIAPPSSLPGSGSIWQQMADAALAYTVDKQSFAIPSNSSVGAGGGVGRAVYYWEGRVPSGMDRFFEFEIHSPAPFVLVYVSSTPVKGKGIVMLFSPRFAASGELIVCCVMCLERLMYEDDFSLTTRGKKVVRFHRSSVARIVRAVFVFPPVLATATTTAVIDPARPADAHVVSVSVLSVRSFVRTVFSKFTTLPQIFFATAFLLIALQYRHFLRYGK